MRVAVVGGTGDLGFGLALRLGRAGLEVTIGSREQARAEDAAARAREVLGTDASVGGRENPRAVAEADVVFVTVPYAGQAAIYKSIREDIPDGAVVCDTTTPLATAVGGRSTHVLRPWQGSAAEQAKELLGERAGRLVAGFHSVGADAMQNLEGPVHGDVLLCGAEAEAKAVVGDLVDRIPGLRWVDCGPLSTARVLEPLTALLISVNRRYGLTDTGVQLAGRETWGRPPG
jgi:8-hydroxy-5-deazaflavin:NADPH oxidoreductase